MLLQVENLTVTIETREGMAAAVRAADFSLQSGETLGVVGESGSGKTMLAMALMGLLPDGAQVTGSVQLDGVNLFDGVEDDWRKIRGERVAMIFQEPMTSLNPLQPVGSQVAEPLVLHRGQSWRNARVAAEKLLDRVGLPAAGGYVDLYPHQLSGGQRQRAMIAMALICGPGLLIADEPTTALDVTVQGQILDLLYEVIQERDMALILISHDLGVVSEMASRILVMYGGAIVERGLTSDVLGRPGHPYTRGLFAARPRLDLLPGSTLAAIPGTVPELAYFPKGCPFRDRCTFATNACDIALPLPVAIGSQHDARCIHLDRVMASHD